MPRISIPIVVQLPVTGILASAVVVPVQQVLEVTDIHGYLQALVSGTFGVRIARSSDGSVLADLSWSASGEKRLHLDPSGWLGSEDTLRFGVTGVGIGASGCTVVVWAAVG